MQWLSSACCTHPENCCFKPSANQSDMPPCSSAPQISRWCRVKCMNKMKLIWKKYDVCQCVQRHFPLNSFSSYFLFFHLLMFSFHFHSSLAFIKTHNAIRKKNIKHTNRSALHSFLLLCAHILAYLFLVVVLASSCDWLMLACSQARPLLTFHSRRPKSSEE